jgi:hypothetical protein
MDENAALKPLPQRGLTLAREDTVEAGAGKGEMQSRAGHPRRRLLNPLPWRVNGHPSTTRTTPVGNPDSRRLPVAAGSSTLGCRNFQMLRPSRLSLVASGQPRPGTLRSRQARHPWPPRPEQSPEPLPPRKTRWPPSRHRPCVADASRTRFPPAAPRRRLPSRSRRQRPMGEWPSGQPSVGRFQGLPAGHTSAGTTGSASWFSDSRSALGWPALSGAAHFVQDRLRPPRDPLFFWSCAA